MSDLGVIASKYNNNTRSLKEFDEALHIIKKEKDIKRDAETAKIINKLLKVLEPISDGIKEKLSQSTIINEHSIIDIIKGRHTNDWPFYRENLITLSSKLASDKFHLSEQDLQILDDIADALDAECTDLFHRMGESR